MIRAYADTLRMAPQNLMEMMQGVDPTDPQSGLDPEKLASMFDTPETRAAQAELQAFLGLVAGYRQVLTRRAAEQLLPDIERLDSFRDAERDLDDRRARFDLHPGRPLPHRRRDRGPRRLGSTRSARRHRSGLAALPAFRLPTSASLSRS